MERIFSTHITHAFSLQGGNMRPRKLICSLHPQRTPAKVQMPAQLSPNREITAMQRVN